MCDGQFTLNPTPWPLQDLDTLLEDSKAKEHFLKSGSSIHALALSWLSNDRTVRVQAEKEGKRRKVRGARAQVGLVKATLGMMLTSTPLQSNRRLPQIRKPFTKSESSK